MNLGLLPRWQRWALFAGLGVALLWLLAWAAVPRLAQWQIEKQGTQLLGRVVQVEQVEFRPWSLSLRVRGLRIGQAGAQGPTLAQPQLSVDEIEVNAALQSLLWWAPVADAIVVRHPQLRLTHQGQGRFDIDDVLQRFSGAESEGAGIPRLSLFNIQIADGGVEFRDEPKSVNHTLSDVRLDMPFLSNIGSRRDVTTHPRLAFKLNGAAFDTDAETAPFTPDRRTQARFQVKGLDVAPYLPYWPAAWPVRLVEGRVALDATLDFRQHTVPQMQLSGHLALTDLKLNERVSTGAVLPLVQLGGLDLKVEAWQPLQAVFKLDALHLDKPVLHVRRDRSGELNWARLQRFFQPAGSSQAGGTKTDPLYVLKQLQVAGGQVQWHDAATASPVSLALSEVDFQGTHLSWPSQQAATVDGKAQFQGGSVSWQGVTDLKSAQGRLKWSALSLKALAPYVAEVLQPELSGQSSAELHLDWRAPAGAEPARLVVKAPLIRVTDVSLGSPGQPEASLAELAVEQLEVDVLQHQASVGRLALNRPLWRLSRNARGRWTFEDWAPRDTPSSSEATGPASPWQLDVRQVQISGGSAHLDDRFADGAVKLEVADVKLSAGPWQPLAAAPAMTPVKLEWRTVTQRREPGRLVFDGAFRGPSLGVSPAPSLPMKAKGRLQLTRWPVHRLSPYWANLVNFDLRRADLSYAGELDVTLPATGMDLNLQGHASVDNLRAVTQPGGEDLLDIQALNWRGLDMGFKSGELVHLKIAETAVNDFFARVAIDPAGKLNLQSMVKPTEPGRAPSAATTPRVELGPIGVVNGRVFFSDHYIRPNYSADVTELAGSLGALSNQSLDAVAAPMAELSLRGRMAGSASLEVNGRINPLTRPVGLDVRGKVRDLELPQLSPYSYKYAGYGIERGKLSAEVTYRIDADGQLQASHQIVLNQLRFGERSDSEGAPNLPVKLAVALLADRHGVIDLNLPVSGSINDPDFRVGAIVWRMVLNLVGKAIISPFSLMAGALGGALGGADELQHMAFAPGHADVDTPTRQKLEAVAQLLLDKPVLRLTIVGEADLAAEREAWRRLKLQDLVKAERRRRPSGEGQDTSEVIDASSEEYLALLKSAYRRSPVPKPRNVLGLPKDLPQADMEALLLAAMPVDESDMRELADARARHVRETLLTLKVPAEQLFMGAAVVSDADPKTPFVPQVTLIVSTD